MNYREKADELVRQFAENEEKEKEAAAKKEEAESKEMSEKEEADKKEKEEKEKDFSERFSKQFSEHAKGIEDRMCQLEEGFGTVLKMCEKISKK